MPQYVINPRSTRAYTSALLEMVDNGEVDKDTLIQDLLGWMSEDSVKGFCEKNFRDEVNDCLIGPEDDEEDEDEDEVDSADQYDIEYDR